MKKLISVISMMSILFVNSYGQNSKVNALLEKPETRKEIFNKILNDHNYMTEFIQAMHGNQHAMMMMNGNNQITGNQGQMGMNSNNQMNGNQGQMGMNGNNPMTGNEGQMSMTGPNHMMDQSSMMNMMNNNPGEMQMLMRNMIDVVSKDSTMSHRMVNMMYSNSQMMQMMKHQVNHSAITGTDGKKK